MTVIEKYIINASIIIRSFLIRSFVTINIFAYCKVLNQNHISQVS